MPELEGCTSEEEGLQNGEASTWDTVTDNLLKLYKERETGKVDLLTNKPFESFRGSSIQLGALL